MIQISISTNTILQQFLEIVPLMPKLILPPAITPSSHFDLSATTIFNFDITAATTSVIPINLNATAATTPNFDLSAATTPNFDLSAATTSITPINLASSAATTPDSITSTKLAVSAATIPISNFDLIAAITHTYKLNAPGIFRTFDTTGETPSI